MELMTTFPTHPSLDRALGYLGDQRFVTWTVSDEGVPLVRDAHGASHVLPFARPQFFAYLGHPSVSDVLCEFKIGQDSPDAQHMLLLDRQAGVLGVATREVGFELIRSEAPVYTHKARLLSGGSEPMPRPDFLRELLGVSKEFYAWLDSLRQAGAATGN